MNHLKDLKGQPRASAILQTYVERLPPPLLLITGPPGTGKFSAARCFVQIHLCDARTACGQCGGCNRFLKGEHPDFIQFPEGKVKIGDPKKPEQYTVRWLLQTRLPYRPHEGGLRFILIPDAAEIQNEAETALLKTLEEPPEHTRFILLAPDIAEMKPTIVSRAVVVPFGLLSRVALGAITGLPDESLDLLGGSLERVALIQSPLFKEMRERAAKAVSRLDILEFESWILKQEKELKSEVPADEIWETLTLAWIAELESDVGANHKRLKVLFDFKAALHMEMAGFLPYAASLLLQRMTMLAPVQALGA